MRPDRQALYLLPGNWSTARQGNPTPAQRQPDETTILCGDARDGVLLTLVCADRGLSASVTLGVEQALVLSEILVNEAERHLKKTGYTVEEAAHAP